jgi:hypothetical protein
MTYVNYDAGCFRSPGGRYRAAVAAAASEATVDMATAGVSTSHAFKRLQNGSDIRGVAIAGASNLHL